MLTIIVNKKIHAADITNDKYPITVRYNGDNLPDIGIEYIYLQWSDNTWHENYWIADDNTVNNFTDEQLVILKEIVNNWEQPLGQDGNPTLEQAQETKRNELTFKFNTDVDMLTNNTTMSEMVSWTKQDAEALAWNSDETTPTPFIDQLLLARNIGKSESEQESKQQLVEKILAKADAYNQAYTNLLGTYQNKLNSIYTCTTVDEVNLIS